MYFQGITEKLWKYSIWNLIRLLPNSEEIKNRNWKKKNGNIELFNILKYIFLYRNSIPPIYYYFLNLEKNYIIKILYF